MVIMEYVVRKMGKGRGATRAGGAGRELRITGITCEEVRLFHEREFLLNGAWSFHLATPTGLDASYTGRAV
jgi:hypothetical protein